ncbi:MAG: hypothetical protein ACPG3T_04100, partial [Pseudomonadales bacterium]
MRAQELGAIKGISTQKMKLIAEKRKWLAKKDTGRLNPSKPRLIIKRLECETARLAINYGNYKSAPSQQII